MGEHIGTTPEPGGDLFQSFEGKPMAELAPFSSAFNIFVSNGDKKGILIGYLDQEQNSPNKVKVLVDGEFEYWSDEQSTYSGAANRVWEKA